MVGVKPPALGQAPAVFAAIGLCYLASIEGIVHRIAGTDFVGMPLTIGLSVFYPLLAVRAVVSAVGLRDVVGIFSAPLTSVAIRAFLAPNLKTVL